MVTLRNHGVTIPAVEVNDLSTNEAWEYATQLHAQSATFDKALVDRFDGLVLIGSYGTYRFKSPLCGYGGTGPNMTAQILELFGFGDRHEILSRIAEGGDRAKAEIYR